jgi:hypothetical protein
MARHELLFVAFLASVGALVLVLLVMALVE